MTLTELRAAVTLQASAWGVSAYTDNTALNGLINFRLRSWSALTRCCYAEGIALDHNASTGPFSLWDNSLWSHSSVAVQLIEIADMYVDGVHLDKLDTSFVSQNGVAYAVGMVGSGWKETGNGTITLTSAPSVAADITASAYYYHPPLVDADDEVVFSPGMDEDFVKYVVEEYILPTATSGDQMNALNSLRARNDAVVAAWRKANKVHPKIGKRFVSEIPVWNL